MTTTHKPATGTTTAATPEVAALHRCTMSYLLLATLELHRLDGVADAAYEFADKALDAIGLSLIHI